MKHDPRQHPEWLQIEAREHAAERRAEARQRLQIGLLLLASATLLVWGLAGWLA